MINLIIDISRYLMILLIALYTYLNFRFFSFPDETRKRKICRRQNFSMFLIHLLAYLIIWLETEDEKMLVFYVAQVIFFFSYLFLYRLIYRNVSRLLVNNMCMLLTIGFIMLTRLSFDRAMKQFVIVAAAALVTFAIPFVIDRVWQLSKIPWIYGIGGILLLGIVCLAGTSSYGAQLSLEFGGYSFQPTEFVKIIYVFFIPVNQHEDGSYCHFGGSPSCAYSGGVQRPWKRPHLLCGLYFHALCGNGKMALSSGRGRRRDTGFHAGLSAVRTCKDQSIGMVKPLGGYCRKGVPDYPVFVCHWNRGLVWHGTVPWDAKKDPGGRKGFYIFSDFGGAGRHFCPLCPSYLSGMLSTVHDDCQPDAGGIL